MKKLKVLEIIGDSTLAGAPRHLLSLIENLDHKKYSIFVICPPGPLAGEIRSIPTVELEIVAMDSKFDLSAISEIRQTIKKIKPNLIHVHGTRAGSLGRLAAIGLNYKIIYTEHLWTKHYKVPSRLGHRIQLIGLWFLDMFTTANIAVSQAVKDFMIENQISREEKVTVIYNGIEAESKKIKIFEDKERVIGTVGTLNMQKGVQYLIEAMPRILKEFPNTELEIIGEGEYRRKLAQLIKKRHLERKVHLLGFVKDIPNSMKRFDIYVQASLSESFGLAILQAMSLGIPVVATNTGGIPEVVTSNKSGLLVKPSDADALSDGILSLLRNPDKAKHMGQLGHEDVKIKFNLKDMVKETENLYEKTAEGSAGS